MRRKKIFSIILIALLACVCVSSCFSLAVYMAGKNLGLFPSKSHYEKFYTAEFTRLTVLYAYTPNDDTWQEIRFCITDTETIKSLQKLFRIEEVSAYISGVPPTIVFDNPDDPDENEWRIQHIFLETEWLLAHNNKKSMSSCVARLTNDSFYDKIMELVYENNKRLFPDCTPDQVTIRDY